MLRSDRTIVFDTDVVLPFQIFDGDGLTDAELQALIESDTAPLKDITGWTIGFYVRKKVNSADPPLIFKSSADSPADVIVNGSFGGSPVQTLDVRIRPTDTYDTAVSPAKIIKAGQYVFAIKRLDTDAQTVLVEGVLTVHWTGAWESND